MSIRFLSLFTNNDNISSIWSSIDCVCVYAQRMWIARLPFLVYCHLPMLIAPSCVACCSLLSLHVFHLAAWLNCNSFWKIGSSRFQWKSSMNKSKHKILFSSILNAFNDIRIILFYTRIHYSGKNDAIFVSLIRWNLCVEFRWERTTSKANLM